MHFLKHSLLNQLHFLFWNLILDAVNNYLQMTFDQEKLCFIRTIRQCKFTATNGGMSNANRWYILPVRLAIHYICNFIKGLSTELTNSTFRRLKEEAFKSKDTCKYFMFTNLYLFQALGLRARASR